jgi:hypothetical protein
MSVPEPKAAFGRVPCQVAKVPQADIVAFEAAGLPTWSRSPKRTRRSLTCRALAVAPQTRSEIEVARPP